jgi:TatD DNase family protein
VRRGYYLSFAGTVTFASAEALREAAAITPIDQIMVETDAPYLTPVPYRGRPNASYLIPVTVRALAATRRTDLDTLCAAISATNSASVTPRRFASRRNRSTDSSGSSSVTVMNPV